MAGLLDALGGFLQSEDSRLPLALLAAAGPQAQPMSFGQRTAGAIGQVQAQKAQEEERRQKAMLVQAQIAEVQAQAQQRQAAVEQAQRQAVEQARQRQLLQQAFAPVSPVNANAASGVAGPRPEALQAVGRQPQVNYQQLIAQGLPPELVKSLAESANYGAPEVARTIEGRDEQGRPVTLQFDKQGRQIGQGVQQWKAPERIDTGGSVNIWDPVTRATLQQIGKTNSPDALLGAQTTIRGQNMTDARARELASLQRAQAGQVVETPSGYVRIGLDNASRPVIGPDGKPLMGKRADQTLTEDQGKATGWLVQAQTAYKNMQDALNTTPSANRPGFPDLYEKVPVLGGMSNLMRGGDRQKFLQASSSFGEAVLRAATGAGVNKDEALQKARELTPQFGDSDEVVSQKMAAFPVYIESLKVRAGPGAAKAAGINAAMGTGPKFLGFE